MKSTSKTLTLVVAMLTFPIAALGEGKEALAGVASASDTIDNVVVVGEKSVADLRREVYEAEENFYAVFNKFNDESDYDVRCFYESPTGSHLKNHVCRARFVTKAYSSHAARSGNKLTRVANQNANPAFIEKTAKYEEKMQSLIAANPELQSALVRYSTARAEFTAQREEIAND